MVRKFSVEEVARRRTLLFGVLAVIFGILIFRNGVGFTKFSLDLLAIYFLVDGLGSFLLRFLLRSKSISYSHSIWFIFLSLALIWLNRLSSLPVNLVVICLGAYQLGSAHLNQVPRQLLDQSHRLKAHPINRASLLLPHWPYKAKM